MQTEVKPFFTYRADGRAMRLSEDIGDKHGNAYETTSLLTEHSLQHHSISEPKWNLKQPKAHRYTLNEVG